MEISCDSEVWTILTMISFSIIDEIKDDVEKADHLRLNSLDLVKDASLGGRWFCCI